MINDRQASELISKSLRQPLSLEESQQVDEHLRTNPKSALFARISQVIQSSLTDIGTLAEVGDPSIAPGLTHEARNRLKQSVHGALLRLSNEGTTTDEGREQPLLDDVLLAATLIEDAGVDESQLIEALKSWIPKPGTLGDHLRNAGLVTDDRLSQATQTLHLSEVSEVSDAEAIARLSAVIESSVAPGEESTEARQVVSRYTLLRTLGQGGLGKVWLARDEKLKRNVAIKETSSDIAKSPRAWQRFHREAEITGHLEHPNVIPLYQYGTDPKRGQPFYVMRFVGKRTLADAIIEYHERRIAGDGDDLDLHRLLNAFLDVCQAIAYAHSRGIVHRDLKPENIALDNFGQVFVLDWGLAKLMDDGELSTRLSIGPQASDSTLAQTMTGDVVGTPLYMAPEQAAGDLDNIDSRTDIFGLGAILYAILTGCAPHEKSHRKLGQGEVLDVRAILDAIANADTPVPQHDNPDVPHELAAICTRAMARKRYARHATAADLAEEVQRWMAGQSRKHEQFENMRVEGRELSASLRSFIRDLGTNARFMASLPPIQGIIDAANNRQAESEDVWRERLATIFHGLLRANSDYSALTYIQVGQDRHQEIVRVERNHTDDSNLRRVPRSRLTSGEISTTDEQIMQQKPEDVAYQFPLTANCEGKAAPLFIVSAAVPIFDQQSEEPFGYVRIESDFNRILDREIRQRVHFATQVVVLNCDGCVLVHYTRSEGRRTESCGKPVHQILADSDRILDALESEHEYLDQANRDTYAIKAKCESGEAGLTILLRQR